MSHRDLSTYDAAAASPDLTSTMQCLRETFSGPDVHPASAVASVGSFGAAAPAVPASSAPASAWKWRRVWACVVGRYLIVAEDDPWRGVHLERTRVPAPPWVCSATASTSTSASASATASPGAGFSSSNGSALAGSASVAWPGWSWPSGISGDQKVAIRGGSNSGVSSGDVSSGGPAAGSSSGNAAAHLALPPLRNQWPAILGVFDLADPAVVAAMTGPGYCGPVWMPEVDDPSLAAMARGSASASASTGSSRGSRSSAFGWGAGPGGSGPGSGLGPDTYAGFSDLSALARVSDSGIPGADSLGSGASDGSVSCEPTLGCGPHGFTLQVCIPVPLRPEPAGSSGGAAAAAAAAYGERWFMELSGAGAGKVSAGISNGSAKGNSAAGAAVLRMPVRLGDAVCKGSGSATPSSAGSSSAAGGIPPAASCYAVISLACSDAHDRADWCSAVSCARRTAQHFPVTLLWSTPPWAVAWCASQGFPVSGHPLLAYRPALGPPPAPTAPGSSSTGTTSGSGGSTTISSSSSGSSGGSTIGVAGGSAASDIASSSGASGSSTSSSSGDGSADGSPSGLQPLSPLSLADEATLRPLARDRDRDACAIPPETLPLDMTISSLWFTVAHQGHSHGLAAGSPLPPAPGAQGMAAVSSPAAPPPPTAATTPTAGASASMRGSIFVGGGSNGIGGGAAAGAVAASKPLDRLAAATAAARAAPVAVATSAASSAAVAAAASATSSASESAGAVAATTGSIPSPFPPASDASGSALTTGGSGGSIVLGSGSFGRVLLERALLSTLVRWPGANVQVYLLHECLLNPALRERDRARSRDREVGRQRDSLRDSLSLGAGGAAAASASSRALLGSGAAAPAVPRGSFPVAVKRFALPPWAHGPDATRTASAAWVAHRNALRLWKVAINEVMALELVRHEYNRRCLLAVNHGVRHGIEFPTLPLLLGIKDADGELAIAMTVIEGVEGRRAAKVLADGGDVQLPVCTLPRTWASSADGGEAVSLRRLASGPIPAPLSAAAGVSALPLAAAASSLPAGVVMCEASARLVLKDLATALALLHGLGIAHRDVKPENVQLFAGRSKSGAIALRAVLLDLGFAFVPDGGADALSDAFSAKARAPDAEPDLHAEPFLSTLFGTRASTAPEVWRAADAVNKTKRLLPSPGGARGGAGAMPRPVPPSRGRDRECMYSEAVDVWGLGVVLFSLLFGSLPFDDHGGLGELMSNITAGRMSMPDGYEATSLECRDLLRRMLATDPADRPTAAQILEDAWVRTAKA